MCLCLCVHEREREGNMREGWEFSKVRFLRWKGFQSNVREQLGTDHYSPQSWEEGACCDHLMWSSCSWWLQERSFTHKVKFAFSLHEENISGFFLAEQKERTIFVTNLDFHLLAFPKAQFFVEVFYNDLFLIETNFSKWNMFLSCSRNCEEVTP